MSAASLRCKEVTRALRQSSLLALRCGGRVPRKISNARFRDMISKALERVGRAPAVTGEEGRVSVRVFEGIYRSDQGKFRICSG